MVRMYNLQNRVVVFVTPKFISRWEQMGFVQLSSNVIVFPIFGKDGKICNCK